MYFLIFCVLIFNIIIILLANKKSKNSIQCCVRFITSPPFYMNKNCRRKGGHTPTLPFLRGILLHSVQTHYLLFLFIVFLLITQPLILLGIYTHFSTKDMESSRERLTLTAEEKGQLHHGAFQSSSNPSRIGYLAKVPSSI